MKEHTLPPWLTTSAVGIIRELLDLPAGWNSYGAKPVDAAAAAAALNLLVRSCKSSTPEPAIVPTNAGGTQIEWHTQGVDLELEIDPKELDSIRMTFENLHSGE